MEGSWTFGFDQFGYLARRAKELLGLLLPQGRHAAPGGSRSCARPIFRAPPLCRAVTRGARPCGRSRPVSSPPCASPAVGLGRDFCKPKALSQCLCHRALPLPRGVSGVGASQNPHREPSSCGGTSPHPGQAPPPHGRGFASNSAEPQVIEPSQGKRKLEKAVGFS